MGLTWLRGLWQLCSGIRAGSYSLDIVASAFEYTVGLRVEEVLDVESIHIVGDLIVRIFQVRFHVVLERVDNFLSYFCFVHFTLFVCRPVLCNKCHR
jgi:hypothetical protein